MCSVAHGLPLMTRMFSCIKEQCNSGLAPYKDELLFMVTCESARNGRPLVSGKTWFCLWKSRNADITSRIPQLAKSYRMNAQLTLKQWEERFETVVEPALDVIGYSRELV